MDDGVDADEEGVEQDGEACMCLCPAQAEKDDDDDAVLLPPYPLCCLGS